MKKSRCILAKLLTLGMALILVLGMSTSAMAVGGGSVPVDKYLVMKSNANTPPASFTFTLTPGPASVATSTKPQIMAGIDTVPAAQTLTFANSDTHTATIPTGKTVTLTPGQEEFATKTATFDFSGVNFTEPGIYRYTLTETGTNDGVTNAGVPNNPIYLDIHINSADDGTLSFANYTLHTTTSELQPGKDPYTLEGKVTGIQNLYTTYDLTLNKQVTGNQGYRSKLFKFNVTISNAAAGTKYTVKGDIDNAGSYGDNIIIPNGGSITVAYYLKHNESITIQGLTENTKYTIVEDIADGEGYTVSRAIEGGTVAGDNTKSTGEVTIGTSDDTVTFTNNREGIVPTGILLDIWPYILIVAVAVVALLLLMRNKRKHATRD